jgi:hypothetical protein
MKDWFALKYNKIWLFLVILFSLWIFFSEYFITDKNVHSMATIVFNLIYITLITTNFILFIKKSKKVKKFNDMMNVSFHDLLFDFKIKSDVAKLEKVGLIFNKMPSYEKTMNVNGKLKLEKFFSQEEIKFMEPYLPKNMIFKSKIKRCLNV